MTLNEIHKDVLKNIYVRCCACAEIKPGYLIRKTISVNKNRVYKAVINSHYETTEFNSVVGVLEGEGLIRSIDNKPGSFVITAKGAWLVENLFYGVSEDDLISSIDDRFFHIELGKLNDKNKIILFALVAVHAYSEKCGINYVEVGAERVFLDLMQDSFTLLKNTGRIELSSFDSIFTGTSNQKKRQAQLTNNIDVMPQCTYSLFVAKKNCYYLDLFHDGSIDKSGLRTIFQIIFNKVKLSEIDTIIHSCKEISLKYGSVFCNDIDLSDSDCNDLIEKCVNDLAGV